MEGPAEREVTPVVWSVGHRVRSDEVGGGQLWRIFDLAWVELSPVSQISTAEEDWIVVVVLAKERVGVCVLSKECKQRAFTVVVVVPREPEMEDQ